MDEPAPRPPQALEDRSPASDAGPPPMRPLAELEEGERSLSPTTTWRPWTAPVALLAGLVLAVLGSFVVDIPALIFGANISSSHTPAGLEIADTVVQDVGFVAVAVYFAHLGDRVVRSWQFGLRRPGVGWRSAVMMILALLVAFVLLSVIWSELVNPERENLLEKLGSNEATSLLLLSAALTCVVAPICEEFLFRGYVFTALRNWRGTLPAAILTGLLFGGVHIGSAPVLDLAPLAALGFGLCLLYRFSGSLYPSIVAHSLNNSVAFASLEGWSLGDGALLAILSIVLIAGVARLCARIGLIAPAGRFARAEA